MASMERLKMVMSPALGEFWPIGPPTLPLVLKHGCPTWRLVGEGVMEGDAARQLTKVGNAGCS